MRTVNDRVIPSSDRLLHDFLKRSSWTVISSNELTLFRMGAHATEALPITGSSTPVVLDPHTTLNEIGKATDLLSEAGLQITMSWSFQEQREIFPWMLLRLTPRRGGPPITISHGLCSPEKSSGEHVEKWRVTSTSRIPPGEYDADALFVDYAKILWAGKSGSHGPLPTLNSAPVSLGQIRVAPQDSSGN